MKIRSLNRHELNCNGDVNDRECLLYILLTVVLGKIPIKNETYLYIS